MSADPALHHSVLLREAVSALVHKAEGLYVDGTFGRGGHARAILAELAQGGRLLAFDKDPRAIEEGEALMTCDSRFAIVHDSFANLPVVLRARVDARLVDGVLLDLGVSSPQLDEAERGFSFLRDGPLDMRMNTQQGESAADWINRVEEREMARVFKEYGEERFAKRIARAIVQRRGEAAFARTLDLAQVVTAANPKWEREKHPATRVFQAIRIAVNGELEDLERFLASALDWLAPGGRLVIISFHSLEDRLVKRFFKEKAAGDHFPKGLPITADEIKPTLKILGKPVKASNHELEGNVRARSAIMRVAEKVSDR